MGEALRWRQRFVVERPYVFGVAAKAALGQEKEERADDGDKNVARVAQGIDEALRAAPVKDANCKGSSDRTKSSFKRLKFHCYTYKIIIYAEAEYGD